MKTQIDNQYIQDIRKALEAMAEEIMNEGCKK